MRSKGVVAQTCLKGSGVLPQPVLEYLNNDRKDGPIGLPFGQFELFLLFLPLGFREQKEMNK